MNPASNTSEPKSTKISFYVGIGVIVLILLISSVAAAVVLLGDDEESDNSSSAANSQSDSSAAETSQLSELDTGELAQTCIITVNGEKYDVQPLRDQHPGGDIFDCGDDMSETFAEGHGDDFARLIPYKLEETSNSETSSEFTLAQLERYSSDENCYVAYRGTVYDVSDQQAWEGCNHKGVDGGQDITNIDSPHTDDIFDGIPVVGTFVE
ncbi:MAG: hypothetical protein ACOCXP_00045 [Candidatus Dojkabacteria bacterium]